MININNKFKQSKKFLTLFSFIKNSSILSLPSIIGIILALIAIPIHLQINGKLDYGNYIFFHFVFTFGLLLNLGINKIVAIELSKKKFINQIIKQSLFLTLKIVLIILLIVFVLIFYLNDFISAITIGLGLAVSILYLTLEGILQGFRKFKFLSISNFIFYTLSLNIPSIALITLENLTFKELILLSILFKSLSVIIILISIKKFFFVSKKNSYNFNSNFKKYSKWYFLHMINLQIFDFVDKYLIKIFMGPVALAIFSIPYQLAGKITIFSKSISAVLLPEIAHGKEKLNFNNAILIYTFLIPVILLFIFPILDELLILWLSDQYSDNILNLTKVFLIVSWISGISHILITYYEAKKRLKFNTLLELYFIIPFLMLLLFIVFRFENLIFISYVLLIKEIFLLFFRTYKIKEKIHSLWIIYLNVIIILMNLLVSIYFKNLYFYSFILLILLNSAFFLKKAKK